VLSSLDDKIALLHRQNKTLEGMAEALWRKMFVEEADPGWKKGKLGDFGQIVCGKTPSKKIAEYFGGHIPFIKIPDMHRNVFIFETEDSLTEAGKKSRQNKTIPAKSICVSCIATVGLVAMNAVDSQTNQQINTIIPNNEFQRNFLFLLMRNMTDDLFARASGGTATDNLNTGDFSRIEISMPSEKTVQKFDDLVRDYFEKIYMNQAQILKLASLRDTLLPKLMSGEARVGL
jgi:type I restriction enzyme S subunit